MSAWPEIEPRGDDQAITGDLCRLLASWSELASSNQTQSHQFRVKSIVFLIGAVSIAEAFDAREAGGWFGSLLLSTAAAVIVIFNFHYQRKEKIWEKISQYVQKPGIVLSTCGYRKTIENIKRIHTPEEIFAKYSKSKISKMPLDLLSWLLILAFLVVNILFGLQIANMHYKITIEKRESQILEDTNKIVPMMKPLPGSTPE